ncbi:MAG: ArsR family transcriptional regulator [Candidatus Methanomethylicota archaeon]|uniref:ArsR family transcriptional regulator n=1 Tax=Thermoproteota archaeon TaxID=2056631 RepID=A0A497EW19_9CREN|nr:MAG: ArsR family transcriptional regulator [Candidatus Verstraetearchaeota archaeon]
MSKIIVEEIFSSKGRVKILRILASIGELNISEIARRANLSYASVQQHLEKLKECNLVIEKRFGRIRIFKFNYDNPIAPAIINLFRSFESEMQ